MHISDLVATACLSLAFAIGVPASALAQQQEGDGEEPVELPTQLPPSSKTAPPAEAAAPEDSSLELAPGAEGEDKETVPEPVADPEAQPEEPAGENPWNEGVTPEDREFAQPFFDAGNGFFERSMYSHALEQYRKAVEHRDHPAIRYNMGICLFQLSQPVEAYENLKAGLAYGEAPLAPGLYREGQNYLKLLEGQLARIRVVVSEAGAKVSLDGKQILLGPGEVSLMVSPQTHQLTATKEAMLTQSQEFSPKIGGELNLFEIEMLPFSAGVITKRRWKPWKPWAVAGAGAGVALLGAPFFVFARQNAEDYDRQVAVTCPASDGCEASSLLPAVRDLRSRAKLQNAVAISLFAVGGVVATTGLVGALVFNRPRAQGDEISGGELLSLKGQRIDIVPLVGQSGTGILSTYGFRF